MDSDRLFLVSQSLNEMVNEALFQWVAVTGVNLDNPNFSIRLDGRMSQYDIVKATEELNESRELDETGLTTWMMLRGLTEAFMKDQIFTAYNLIFNPEPIRDKLTAMNALHASLEDPLVLDFISTFIDKCRETATRFGLKDTTRLEELLADKYDLAWLRRDALLSMKKLSVHQFTQGEGDKLPIGLNPHVYEVWNVNSLVLALRAQGIPGITTVLVRDPEAMHSFFVLAVKNGSNITILTDKDEEAHPAAKRMSRRPDRQLARRAGQHWFPYQLLDLQATEDGKHLYAAARTSLVPINTEAVKLANINELGASQFLWLMMVGECVRETFWKHNFHTPELSYTGEMVVEPHALVGADGGLVKAGLYQPLELPPLKPEDVTSEATREQWEQKPTYFYDWMVERYGHEVTDDVLNVTGTSQRKLLEASHELLPKDYNGQMMTHEWNGHEIVKLESLDPQNFGTKEKIEKDRVWAARHNQMLIIRKRADEEYKKEKDNIKAWVKKAVEANAEFLVNAAARQELILPQFASGAKDGVADEYERHMWSADFHLQERNALQWRVTTPSMSSFRVEDWPSVCLGTFYDQRYHCYDNDTAASYSACIKPTSPEALAVIFGMPKEQMPWPLQHWYGHNEPYSGNNILDRLDPIDWVLENPWREFKIIIGVTLSKRAFAARRKAMGLPPIRLVEGKKEDQY